MMYQSLDEWFDDVPHPHDTMPIATDRNEFPAELMEVPTSMEPISYASRHESTPDFEKDAAVSYTHLTLPTNREV